MFDPKKLLDSLLGPQGLDPRNQGRPGANPQGASGGFGAAGGGFLGDIANTLGGPDGIRQGAGRVADYARQNPMAAGAILAGILGTGMGRGLAGSALKYGGLAAIASMAYNAYQNHQAGRAPEQPAPAAGPAELAPPPADTPFNPAQAPQGETEFAVTLLRAMIAAARADGTIDAEERRRIADKAKLSGMEAEAQEFLLAELMKPVDLEALAAEAQTEAQRVELYTASRLAIDPDGEAERDYLARLAARLGLPQSLVDHVEVTVRSAQAA
jgi:uncharacterized membrane protein YebE (DUF533 family)